MDIIDDMEELCPDAVMLNFTNPCGLRVRVVTEGPLDVVEVDFQSPPVP